MIGYAIILMLAITLIGIKRHNVNIIISIKVTLLLIQVKYGMKALGYYSAEEGCKDLWQTVSKNSDRQFYNRVYI